MHKSACVALQEFRFQKQGAVTAYWRFLKEGAPGFTGVRLPNTAQLLRKSKALLPQVPETTEVLARNRSVQMVHPNILNGPQVNIPPSQFALPTRREQSSTLFGW